MRRAGGLDPRSRIGGLRYKSHGNPRSFLGLIWGLCYNVFNCSDDTDNPDIVPWHREETGPTRLARPAGTGGD